MTTGTVERGPEVRVMLCPVCGSPPQRVEYDLGKPGGRGYPGHKTYQYKCEFCNLVRGTEVTDIYEAAGQAINRAKLGWNTEVERIRNHLRRQWVPRTSVKK